MLSNIIGCGGGGSGGDFSELLPLVTGSKFKGTYTYTDLGGEQILLAINTDVCLLLHGIWLDMVNITQPGQVSLYYKIDGVNYRSLQTFDYNPTTDENGFFIALDLGITDDFQITYAEGADEGSDRAIQYSIIYDTKQII